MILKMILNVEKIQQMLLFRFFITYKSKFYLYFTPPQASHSSELAGLTEKLLSDNVKMHQILMVYPSGQ